MKTNCIYKSHKRSHSTKLRLMQKYVNAYMRVFISLSHYAITILTPILVSFILQLSLFFSLGVARQSHWLSLGRGSKRQTNSVSAECEDTALETSEPCTSPLICNRCTAYHYIPILFLLFFLNSVQTTRIPLLIIRWKLRYALPVSFHQSRSYATLIRRTSRGSQETFKQSNILLDIGKHWREQYFYFVTVLKGLYTFVIYFWML
jgi:hypothetical protein